MLKFAKFRRECVAEFRRVVWPARTQVHTAVKVVLVSTVVMALFLGLIDALFVALMSFFF